MEYMKDKHRKKHPIWQLEPGVYATPYGWVQIARGGKSISFNLFANMRASAHDRALISIVMQLYRAGVKPINADHLNLPFLDTTLTLRRANRTLDFVYHQNGKLREAELATRRQVGLDSTWQKVRDLIKWCKTLEVWVPHTEKVNTHEILTMLGLFSKVKVITYQEVE